MTRPVNLKLIAFRFPIGAIVSILHRISGIVLFAGVGYLSYLLSRALNSQNDFDWVVYAIGNTYHGFLIWAVLVSLAYHLLAGIRHLFLDIHLGDSVQVSSRSATVVLIVTVLISFFLGFWIIF